MGGDPWLDSRRTRTRTRPSDRRTSGSSPTGTSCGWGRGRSRVERRAAVPVRAGRTGRGSGGDPRTRARARQVGMLVGSPDARPPGGLVDRLHGSAFSTTSRRPWRSDGAERGARRRARRRRGEARDDRRRVPRGGEDRRDRLRRRAADPPPLQRPGQRGLSGVRRRPADRRASASFGERGAALFGGSTLPEARGRGAYRALVAARWDDAVARGTPVLVTQAGPMSRPSSAGSGSARCARSGSSSTGSSA